MDTTTSSVIRSDMEETGTNNTKVSDSAYSNSCSNSQSQRSGSSKSRHSTSSGSSGYCGHPSTASSSSKAFPQPSSSTKRSKDHKKKKSKTSTNNASSNTRTINEHHNDSNNNNAGATITDSPVDNPPCNNNSTPNAETALQFNNISTPTKDSEALQTAVLVQTFSCIKKLKNKDLSSDENELENSHMINIDNNQQQQIINSLKTDTSHESEFCIVVSMQDGIVLYTTPSINDVLGYPVDMWVGRSLIDFVHPKDRIAFASNISTGIANPQLEYNCKHGNTEDISSKCHSFFCCVRRYRGLGVNGFGVTDKKVSYLPCQLTTRFKEVKLNHEANAPPCIFLVVTAQAASSAYKFPDESKMSPKFMTQHSATSYITHVDPEVVPYFGFLPQDMIGRTVFDFYHPEDLVYIKEVYEAVIKEQGQPVCSKPYKFRCQNGCYVLLETEWSSFINPWTRKLEFVIGQHRVLKGPSKPDVLTPVDAIEPLQMSEEALKESKTIQEQIQNLLSETVVRNSEKSKRQVATCCKDLASFMETLMDEYTKPPDLKLDVANESHCVSDRDSVMLGGISPHSDYYDSKYSSETPPSYNQLNYNENIQRFFESKPKTTLSDGSRENKNNTNPSSMSGGDEEEKGSVAVNFKNARDSRCMKNVADLVQQNQKSGLPDCHFENKNEDGGNGHSSRSGLSSASAGNLDSHESRGETSATDTSNTSSYKPLHLTAALLYKHNEDMEKQMVLKHREQRVKPDRRSKHKDGRHKMGYNKIQGEGCYHGVKRSGSHSWEGEPFKTIKQSHGNNGNVTDVTGEPSPCTHSTMFNASIPQRPVYQPPLVNHSVNQWPPFSVTVTPLHPSQPCSASPHMNFTPQLVNPMMPVYYMEPMSTTSNINGNNSHFTTTMPSEHPGPPNLQQQTYNMQQNTYIRHQVQYWSNMMYQPLAIPLFGPQPVMYAPSAEIPTPTQMMQPTQIPRNSRPIPSNNISQQASTDKQIVQVCRPSSQATSIKAEPGSALCSVASASLKQALSESSKKAGKSVCSPAGLTSYTISSTGKHKEGNVDEGHDEYSCDMDGSYNSLYSFLKTEPSDDSMKSSIINDDSPLMEMVWEKTGNITMETDRPWPLRKEPPWLEDIEVTPELVFRYQISESREIDDILKRDLEVLDRLHQPCMVNEQLSQLYLDLEGLSKHLTLEESILSSSGSSGEDNVTGASSNKSKQKKKKFLGYDRMAMIFEESAPLPPPDNVLCT